MRVRWISVGLAGLWLGFFAVEAAGQRTIPEPLRPWQDWATWDVKDRDHPPLYNSASTKPGLWPGSLRLEVGATSGRFTLGVTIFSEMWVPLPGEPDMWPRGVVAGGRALAVTSRNNRPAVRLPAGSHEISGTFAWSTLPAQMRLPSETGMLTLVVDGRAVPEATWNADGVLWLRGQRVESAGKDYFSAVVYRALTDGIPMRLVTEVELSVSGKSREELVGDVLPEGWRLEMVESPLPVAVDENGRMKAQVRAGKWTVRLTAFRLNDAGVFRYAQGARPVAADELIAFQARPDFRLLEILGVPVVDVAQTSMPEKWRSLPVYRWQTSEEFQLEERMRGMGLQKPEGLRINREVWLDEDGRGLVFRDRVSARMQQTWRLDAAEGRELGAVRVGGEGQLITHHPRTGRPGVELRTRNPQVEATGTMPMGLTMPATGWEADADLVHVDWNLPPGWRLFAVFGADWVQGDRLTSWTLLDLFLWLVFGIAVFRLWGPGAGVLALVGFALMYHEPQAPRFIWLFLLVPLALMRVVPAGWARQLVLGWKVAALVVFVLVAVPFVARQLQGALYPQLERDRVGIYETLLGYEVFEGAVPRIPDTDSWGQDEILNATTDAPTASPQPRTRREAMDEMLDMVKSPRESSILSGKIGETSKSNLLYDTKARIQTGPGIPDWSWRRVSFGWNGPVTAAQTVRVLLVPDWLERLLAVVRVGLLVALAGVLLGVWRAPGRMRTGAAPGAMAGVMAVLLPLTFLWAPVDSARAQMPDRETLQMLRERLMEAPEAFPNAAEISSASLTLRDRRVVMESEVHVAARCAVPLPGRLPSWSPLSVTVNGRPGAVLRRDNGFLWVVLPSGVHSVRVEGMLGEGSEWEWSFLLRPRRVEIDAPGWNVTGLRADGVPEGQVFFARQVRPAAGEATYDRQETQSVLQVVRHLEMGLVWKVRNEVTRVSSSARAVSIRVPLLPGEKVLTPDVVVEDGHVEVRMGAQQRQVVWQSELETVPVLDVTTSAQDNWYEQWRLVASPVWHVEMEGLEPVFEEGSENLHPVWTPWPGESARLIFSRPEAVGGETITVQRVRRELEVGRRQRVGDLSLDVDCTMGQDLVISLPEAVEITLVEHDGRAIPVRRDGDGLVVPLRPGSQTLRVRWTDNTQLGFFSRAGTVRLPVPAANVTTAMQVPDDRWILWTHGPMQGPAVRFWSVLLCALLAAWVLARIPGSPLRTVPWLLLGLGLTQVSLAAALLVAGWLFALGWRGRSGAKVGTPLWFNLLQVALAGLTLVALVVLISVVASGLLGHPDMFIRGNGSWGTFLQWYVPSSDGALPQPGFLSVSIWFYRLLMLAWALWLAQALIGWLTQGWRAFATGGLWRKRGNTKPLPPPMPS